MLSPRILRLALAASVAVNLAVAGVVAGAVLRDPPPPDPDRGPAFGMYDRAFTEADRKALRQGFRDHKPAFREGWRALQQDTADLVANLRADPYDPARTADIFARQAERGERMMQLGQGVVAEYLAAMSPEDRHAFAQRLEDRLHRDRRP